MTALYVNQDGRLACARHAGYMAHQSILHNSGARSHAGIQGDVWSDVDAHENGDTLRAAFADAGFPVQCEDC